MRSILWGLHIRTPSENETEQSQHASKNKASHEGYPSSEAPSDEGLRENRARKRRRRLKVSLYDGDYERDENSSESDDDE